MSEYEGAFARQGAGIAGWARQVDGSAPVWVEALADDMSLGCALARQAEPHGCGFWLPLPLAVLEDGAPVAVRIANTEFYLPDESGQDKGEAAAGGQLQGELFVDKCLGVSGWALDPMDPDARLQLRILEKGVVLDKAAAAGNNIYSDQARGHGFKFVLPAFLADGREHMLHLEDSRGRKLPGSPFYICAPATELSSWLRGRKAMTSGEKDMLAQWLEYLEMRYPGSFPLAGLQAWKNAFPVMARNYKNRVSLRICMAGQPAGKSVNLGRQHGVNLDLNSQNPEFTFFLSKNEKIHPMAIARMLEALAETGADVVYADGETPDGQPLFKPAWDREAFLARDYLGPVLVRSAIVGHLLSGESYTALRTRLLMAADEGNGVAHLPEPLMLELPVANDDQRLAAVNEWLGKLSGEATRQDAEPFRIRYALKHRPKVSILIPTKDHAHLLKTCMDSLQKTEWPDLEILVMDNGSTEPEALDLLERLESVAGVRVLPMPGVFNFAALNNRAAKIASGELLCFLNNDTEILHAGWLEEMAALLLSDSRNGCVGAKLLWPNGLVQHGGVLIGAHDLASHAGNAWLEDEPGYMQRNQFAQQYSAVTAACCLTPKKLFLDMGGFDARAFAVNFNDVDYCLRLRQKGMRVLWTPFARLGHHESASRGKKELSGNKARSNREMALFRARWGRWADPFYNPNFALNAVCDPFTALAIPPGKRYTRYEQPWRKQENPGDFAGGASDVS